MSSIDVNLNQMANPHVYQPLDGKQHHFRLLRLHAGRRPQPVVCTLYSEHLKRGKDYEALSYVWGDPNVVKDILVNGQPLPVTENLNKALHRLRRLKESRILWIDAICINQKDDLEKSHQVDLMSRIYTFASGVVIWLEDVPSEDEMSAISAFNNFRDRKDQLATVSGTPSRKGIYCCYERIMSSPWFTRSWTVQEALLARKLTVMLGPGYANFDNILGCEERLWRTLRDTKVEVIPGRYRDIADMRKQRRYPGGKGLTFLNAIHNYWAHQATDSGDKTYAFLGIVNDWQGFNAITSNYTLDTDKVFARATFEIIRRQRSIEFLSTVVLSSGGSDGKPSWVPSFTSATLKRAKERHNSRPSADIHLYDTTVLSLNGAFRESIVSVSLEHQFAEISIVEDSSIYREALEYVTGIPGVSKVILMVNRLLQSTTYKYSPEMMCLRSLSRKQWSLLQPEKYWSMTYDSASRIDHASDDEIWNEFKIIINTNGKDIAPVAREATSLATLNAIIKRWMCWRSNELACTTKQSYVGAFSEHMDTSLLLRHDEPAVKFKERFAFTTGDGSIGFAPPVAPGDEIWAFEEQGTPFILRPAGSRAFKNAQEGKMVQTYKLVGRCLSLFHPDQFDILNPQLERKQTENPSRRVYLC